MYAGNQSDQGAFAVLFKVHFWDEYAERQYQRLLPNCAGADVFIVVDETHGAVRNIPHENVLRIKEKTSIARGYFCHPIGRSFWHNNDYPFYEFIAAHPGYDYIICSEYDVVVKIPLRVIIDGMIERQLDLVADPIRESPDKWVWGRLAKPLYPEISVITGRLMCFAAVSSRFIDLMSRGRLELGQKIRQQNRATEVTTGNIWPLTEAFVGALIHHNPIREEPLSSFGDNIAYDWAPPFVEASIDHVQSVFMHPVLDDRRFLASVIKLTFDLHDCFKDGSWLQQQFRFGDPSVLGPALVRHFIEIKDWRGLAELHDDLEGRYGRDRSRPWFNFSKGQPATQSSRPSWSTSATVSIDAAGAVNGNITGSFGFHTDQENEPWWCVDLQFVVPIREARIYNRLDVPWRARGLMLSVSDDMSSWRRIFTDPGVDDFGGADGNPLVILLDAPISARFVKLHLPGEAILHLDQVEVYV